jgi:D-alanyl-D-alanine carboxypeptidase
VTSVRLTDDFLGTWVGSAPRIARAVLVLLSAALFALMAGAWSPPTLAAGDPLQPGIDGQQLAALRDAPTVPASVRAAAAIVIDGEDGRSIAGRNPTQERAQASLTKMTTALVALDNGALADTVTATEHSLSEPTVIGLEPGDQLTLEDMTYGLLLPSGNDAALAIAENVGHGSIDRFVGWMNDWVAARELHHTHYANPHGLDQRGHFSSAYDLSQITRALMGNPTLAAIVGTQRRVVPGPPLYLFLNSNPLLGSYPGIEGVKTGFTDDAGRCLTVSATRDGRRMIAVVLDSPAPGPEATAMLDLGFARTHSVQLAVPRPGFSAVQIAPPGSSPVAFASSTSIVGWEPAFLRAFTPTDGGAPIIGWTLDEEPFRRRGV